MISSSAGPSSAGPSSAGPRGLAIIALDIDGVLLNRASMNAEYEARQAGSGERGSCRRLDPAACERLRGVTEAHGARILLSSSWARQPELVRALYAQLPWLRARLIGLCQGSDRGQDIQAWASWLRPGALVCVDDDASRLRARFGSARVVATRFEDGLDDARARELADKLSAQQSGGMESLIWDPHPSSDTGKQ